MATPPPARINFCPVCGERMALETKTNADGDTLQRWRCTVTDDYAGEWDVRSLAPGTTATPVADQLSENPIAREATAAQTLQNLKTRLDDLLARVGPVPAGGSMVEELRRIYSAVDTLELTSESIALNADSINLNTDTLETLTTSTNTRLGDPGDPDTADTVIGRLKSLRALISAAEAARNTDATTAQARLDLLATEAGLTSARDTLSARLDTANAHLDSMATLAELTDLRQVSETWLQRRARDGMAYMASTGQLSLTVSGNVRALLSNPGASTRRICVYRVVGATSAGPAWAGLRINPTLGLPAATKPISNVLLGGPASVASIAADVNTTDSLTGGTDTGLVYAMFSGRTVVDIPAPIIVSPGNALGFNVPFTGASDAAISVYWYEEAV